MTAGPAWRAIGAKGSSTRSSPQQKPNGTGLGLFSVKACATALGGRVTVGDSPLGGATFAIALPVEGPAPRGGHPGSS